MFFNYYQNKRADISRKCGNYEIENQELMDEIVRMNVKCDTLEELKKDLDVKY